jgi:hypothetical protein
MRSLRNCPAGSVSDGQGNSYSIAPGQGDANAHGGCFGTALQAASRRGNDEIVRLLRDYTLLWEVVSKNSVMRFHIAHSELEPYQPTFDVILLLRTSDKTLTNSSNKE